MKKLDRQMELLDSCIKLKITDIIKDGLTAVVKAGEARIRAADAFNSLGYPRTGK